MLQLQYLLTQVNEGKLTFGRIPVRLQEVQNGHCSIMLVSHLVIFAFERTVIWSTLRTALLSCVLVRGGK